jgi:hypothetical protein
MTQDEIIDMAIQVGIKRDTAEYYKDELKAFASFVAEKELEEFGLAAAGILERTVVRAVAKEREACAKVCDLLAEPEVQPMYYRVAANKIRARGEA